MLAVETRPGGVPESIIVALKGPLVVYDLFSIQRLLREDLTAHTIMDMTEVPYMDSAGVGMLINAYVSRQKSGRTFALVGVKDRPMAVLKITHVDSVIPRYASIEEAEKASGNNAARAGNS